MDTKLTPMDNEIYQRIDEMLHYKWVPVGISDESMARNEYYSYFSKMFKMIKEGLTLSITIVLKFVQENGKNTV
jgi:hypothetical protein